AFGGNPKGGKITGKGKIKTGKLDFDDIYYVKELKFNLFSVSQMLGHVNFKTVNKLVKRNLVRGLPSKVFTNDLICVACKKSKQHKASCSGLAWLFDIDSLSQTMNYHPVLTENQSNPTVAREQGDKVVNKDKGKSHVVTITGFGDLNEEFTECINNSSNGVSAAGPSVSVAGLEFKNSTNDFTAAGPLVSAA
nr:ribonuclease H-like domain-containing protein [Tanacetum cinerariifolium]